MEIIFKKIVERILEVKKDLSIYAFAKELGMNQVSLDRYVKEQRKPSVELIATICQRFGVDANWLLGLTDHQSSITNHQTLADNQPNPSGDCAHCMLLKVAELMLKSQVVRK